MPWREHADHPNAAGALKYRHQQLKRAATKFEGSRISVVCSFARNKKVLDVGCVSHNFTFRSGGTGNWLHDHVRKAAAECVGADYDELGIKLMREAGYDVVRVDITGDLTPVLERGPFDVVIAGEIIEHLVAPQELLSMARTVLRPGGQLVLTTPNPYSPRRNRTGAAGVTWENVDHIVYAFPSGIAEMADRTGMALTKFGTVGWPATKPVRTDLWESVQMLYKAVRARAGGERNQLGQGRVALPLPVFWQSPLDILVGAARGRTGMLRETSIYVLTRPAEEPAPQS
jgi:2-polyprenyl-3-methyl-5-hydroxy-6-metoxy-1,4-benzoquinol methylase